MARGLLGFGGTAKEHAVGSAEAKQLIAKSVKDAVAHLKRGDCLNAIMSINNASARAGEVYAHTRSPRTGKGDFMPNYLTTSAMVELLEFCAVRNLPPDESRTLPVMAELPEYGLGGFGKKRKR